MRFTPPELVVYTLLVFLAGMAVPLLILRVALPEREDSCFLSFVLGAIAVLALATIAVFFLMIRV